MMDFTSNWGWPQWIVVSLWAIRLLVESVEHGKPRGGHHNLAAALIACAIAAVVLAKGGFFR